MAQETHADTQSEPAKTIPPTPCECPLAGHCQRHGIFKTKALHRLCQTNPSYFHHWEHGAAAARQRTQEAVDLGLDPATASKAHHLSPEQLQEIAQRPKPKGYGPGTELKKLIAKYLRIKVTPACKCNQRAQIMDANGPEWCRENINTIVSWLKEEAYKRGGLIRKTFSKTVALLLIHRAIERGEKEIARREATEAPESPSPS